jgi:hypothetical protein
MTQRTITLAPEVRELLFEIAKDPRSTLFGTTPSETVIAATMDLPSASAGTAGWTSAEGHLLSAYREELAIALGSVFHLLSVENPGLVHFIEADGVVRSREREQAAALVRSPLLAGLDEELRSTVTQIAGGTQGKLALDKITNVICRLRNDHRSANLHGMALMLEGKLQDAADVLQRVLGEAPRPTVFYCAATNLGLVRTLRGLPAEAYIECYSSAVQAVPGPEALASLMSCSCLTGQVDTFKVASSYFNDVVSPDDPYLSPLCRVFGNWVWEDQALGRLRDLRSHIDGPARRLIDAALE